MRIILIGLIRFYRYFLSPWVGAHCRFHPSCSCYALEAIEHHGALRGSFYTMKRLSRCHPWHVGGFDPVPEKMPEQKSKQPAEKNVNTRHGGCLHG